MQNLRSIDAVAKRGVLEHDVAANRGEGGAGRVVGGFRRRVENVAETGDGEPRLMKILPDLGQPQHRCAHPAGQHVESDELADGQASIDDELRPEVQSSGDHQLVDELHSLTCRVAEADDAKARGHVAGELFFPAALHLRLDRHGLERLDPGHALDQERLVLGAALELLVEPAAEQRRHSQRDRDVEREGAEHDAGQQRRVEEHHRQEHKGEEQVDDEGQRRAGEKIADVLQFAHPRHRIAHAPRLKVGHRQGQQMVEQARAEFDVDAVGGMREQIGPQDSKYGLEDRDGDQSENEDVESAERPVHQHLVDHHLEEQR